MAMKTYHWLSHRFADWQLGEIIVRAPSVDAARKKALKEHNKQFPSGYDEKTFLADIASEPDEIEVLFVYGGG